MSADPGVRRDGEARRTPEPARSVTPHPYCCRPPLAERRARRARLEAALDLIREDPEARQTVRRVAEILDRQGPPLEHPLLH